METQIRNLILILGDQLSASISSLKNASSTDDHILMVEVMEEATYVQHHKKKIAFIFSAMRHFARELRTSGWRVEYVELDDRDNSGSISGEVTRAVKRLSPERIVITEPGEWRVREAVKSLTSRTRLPVDILPDDRFLCSHDEFKSWVAGRKQLRMEYFYREMRRKTGLLMDGKRPEGGKWNYDTDNRKPAKADLFMPQPLRVPPDKTTARVLSLVSNRFNDHFGDLEPFWFGVTRHHAESSFTHFLETALPSFGDYQDAMLKGEYFLYHSVVSLYLNVGLLDPLKICREAEAAYQSGHAPLNAVEGFIRQVIGWREYVRGLYWLKMPGYVNENFFENDRSLPDFYWSGETDMYCMRETITQTTKEAYAHHIQRLMVTGNFALLAGIDPYEVHKWYLSVYVDALEWVELPNTLGMSQFADGGLLGSKPYAASGSYINKMSDYCSSCRYDVKIKTGEKACPFNPLYWDFLHRNREKLEGNPRITQMYRIWDKISADKKQDYLDSADVILSKLN